MTMRRARGNQRRNQISTRMMAGVAALVVVVLGAWYLGGRAGGIGQAVQLRDIHGLGFSADGRQLFVPAHDGLRIFEDGHWLVPDLPANDYMGYAQTNDGFYSSGHPGPGSNRINPLGLVKSSDGGQTLTSLGFGGESDFHLMAVGYESHAVYVFNPRPNSTLSAGLHYSLNDGQSWEQSRAEGITGNPVQLAVHPTVANVVAVATEGGLFLSNDHGNTFTRVSEIAPVTSVSFDPDGSNLVFGYQSLYLYNLESGQTSPLQSAPVRGDDAVGYIAVNPVSDQLAFATFNRDVFLSPDNGQSWTQIAQQGVGES